MSTTKQVDGFLTSLEELALLPEKCDQLQPPHPVPDRALALIKKASDWGTTCSMLHGCHWKANLREERHF